jgi:hypothetical protein
MQSALVLQVEPPGHAVVTASAAPRRRVRNEGLIMAANHTPTDVD